MRRVSILHSPFSIIVVALTLATTAIGCRNEMYNQEKAEPLEQSLFFADSQASRPILEGTVPRGAHVIGAPDATRRDTAAMSSDSAGGPQGRTGTAPRRAATIDEIRMMSIPVKVTRAVLDRGRERYDIFCSPCHGRTGDGNGMIVQRGFPQPPSLHLDRLRTAADGHYYDVITNGFGAMYSYANRVKPDDRWAIAAYIRALQLSRSADAPLRNSAAGRPGERSGTTPGGAATTAGASAATTISTDK